MKIAAAQIQVKPLLDLNGETRDPDLSPDGRTLVFQWCKPDYSCGIYTRPLAGGEVRLLIESDRKEGLTTDPRWSPNGKRIAFTRFYSQSNNHLFVRNLDSGAEKDMGEVCDQRSRWSPDGRFLMVSVYAEDPPRTFTCRLVLISVETGMRIRQIAPHGGAFAFSPDGRTLAYSNGSALMLRKLTADYRPAGSAATVAREPREISNVDWTPDGKQIIYEVGGDAPYLRRVTPGSRASPQSISNPAGQLSVTQLLSDGRSLATETTRVEALWRADLTSTPVKLDTGIDPPCFSGAPGCSSDGRRRAFIDARTGILEIWVANVDGTDEQPLVSSIPAFVAPEVDGAPNRVDWSPDGKWIAFTVLPRDGNADLRSYLYVVPASGGMPRRLGKEAYALNNPIWSRDSKSLYAGQGWSVDDQTHGLNDQIVRVDVASGRLTSIGADGIWPRISPDGKFVYFFTSPYTMLSRIQASGGAPERLQDKHEFLWYCVGVGAHFIYLFQEPQRNDQTQIHRLMRFDPETRQATALADVPFAPRFAYLSPDEHFLYFQQEEDSKQRVVLVERLF